MDLNTSNVTVNQKALLIQQELSKHLNTSNVTVNPIS